MKMHKTQNAAFLRLFNIFPLQDNITVTDNTRRRGSFIFTLVEWEVRLRELRLIWSSDI